MNGRFGSPITLPIAWALLAALSLGVVASAQESSGRRERGASDSSVDSLEARMRRFDRAMAFLKQLDTNKNGQIDPEEVTGSRKTYVERMIERAGMKAKFPISLRELQDGLQKYYTQEPPASGSTSSSNAASTSARPTSSSTSTSSSSPTSTSSASFGIKTSNVGGFGDRSAIPSSGGFSTPSSSGTTTSMTTSSSSATTTTSATTSSTPAEKTTPAPEKKKSYRLLSPTERLPKGLPEWFTQKDTNGDGQVTMAEFSSTWNDEVAAEFAKYDLNNDGVITAEECLKALKRAAEKEKPAEKK